MSNIPSSKSHHEGASEKAIPLEKKLYENQKRSKSARRVWVTSEDRLNARKVIYLDLFFVFLPFIILFIIQAIKGTFPRIWENSDWSIAAAVLSLQTAVRFVSGATKFPGHMNYRNISLWNIFILVLTFMNLIVYIILQVSEEPLLIFQLLQIPLFLASVYASLIFGSIGELLNDIGDRSNKFRLKPHKPVS